ncbi:hypothetical protein D3C79_681360 [compost metagenome]
MLTGGRLAPVYFHHPFSHPGGALEQLEIQQLQVAQRHHVPHLEILEVGHLFSGNQIEGLAFGILQADLAGREIDGGNGRLGFHLFGQAGLARGDGHIGGDLGGLYQGIDTESEHSCDPCVLQFHD